MDPKRERWSGDPNVIAAVLKKHLHTTADLQYPSNMDAKVDSKQAIRYKRLLCDLDSLSTRAFKKKDLIQAFATLAN